MLVKTAFVGLVTGFCLLLLEGMMTAFAWFQYGTIDVQELLAKQTGNVVAADLAPAGGIVGTSRPHPHLGWVNNEQANGPTSRVNNVGLIGRDFPLVKDQSKFTILLTGGSVANAVGMAGEGDRSYLEAALDSIDGKPVVVLNGANGAWSQPQQLICTAMYGELADAVITLDGFNEIRRCLEGRLERPSARFEMLNPGITGGYDNAGRSWQARQFDRFASTHNWRVAFFGSRALRRMVVGEDSPAQASDLFTLPSGWSEEQRIAFNMDLYRKYLREIDAICLANGSKAAHFIQPVPQIGKALTADELKVVDKSVTPDAYRRLETELLKSPNVISLTDVFDRETDSIYVDGIHCRWEKSVDLSHEINFRKSHGYSIMAERIAAELARLWSIPLKAER